ncbi:MAG: hypothetical protein ACLQU1_37125 [Bryobacteraceae bacterium]
MAFRLSARRGTIDPRFVDSVTTSPGPTAFNRLPWLACSSAIEIVKFPNSPSLIE